MRENLIDCPQDIGGKRSRVGFEQSDLERCFAQQLLVHAPFILPENVLSVFEQFLPVVGVESARHVCREFRSRCRAAGWSLLTTYVPKPASVVLRPILKPLCVGDRKASTLVRTRLRVMRERILRAVVSSTVGDQLV